MRLAVAEPAPVASRRARFQRDMHAAQARLSTLAAWTATPGGQIRTPAGELCLAVRGEGYPVLISHGAMGGFDRALELGEQHLGPGYQVLAPSRYGYPGSSMPPAATPASQATAFVTLLDHMKIDRAAVIAHGTGGVAAVQMALRYPDRLSALVLVAALIGETELRWPFKPLLRRVVRSNFLFWLLMNPSDGPGRHRFTQRGYIPGAYETGELASALLGFLPVRSRRAGALFDIYVSNPDPIHHPNSYRLEELDVPALCIYARDDPLIAYADARIMHERLYDARLVTVPAGGHLMLGHGGLLRAEIDTFIQAHA